ncbi:response regulator [Litoribrevibacter albus]|uniref:DNA-binding response regulator n=1 Tax=Litoribrevibacter albus TaxID=1473156 RepID=A0AA37SBY1_9GAMM|nr:response regulator [Litoribrevibacter albus]GLQ31928.1 DNA-binding response regulator [Litoribrevibacter albus]
MTEQKKLVYIVEDEIKLARLLEDYLIAAGYLTQSFHDGQLAFNAIKQNTPDLVLLDLMLPSMDGISIARETRLFSNVPIIMVTAKVEEVDRLLGLELGADDYVCKPFSPKEIVARVKAIFRRVEMMNAPIAPAGTEKVSVDEQKMQVVINGTQLDLTTLEFQVFFSMFKEPGRIFSRQQLMDTIYSDHRVVSDRTIDSHVKKLRKKISVAFDTEEIIQSVYGAGYKYEPPAV